MTSRQPHREKRTKHLEQRIDMLTELVNTLVMALGQNAANVTPTIPPGIPLANAGGEEKLPRPTLACIESALGVGIRRETKIEEMYRACIRLDTPEIQCLIGSNE